MTAPTYADIWRTLSAVDVSPYVEIIPGRGKGLSYLAWPHAWACLMAAYPQAEVEFERFRSAEGAELDVMIYPDGSAAVSVTVRIGECARSVSLPVMDNKHNAIINPDSRTISDTRQRALVKVLGFFGLGLSLWSDTPPKAATRPKAAKPAAAGASDESRAAMTLCDQIAHADTESELLEIGHRVGDLLVSEEWRGHVRPIWQARLEEIRFSQDEPRK